MYVRRVSGLEVASGRRDKENEVRMQMLLLVAAVLVSIATALASAAGLLNLLFHLISKLR